jgi:hypothetical protein
MSKFFYLPVYLLLWVSWPLLDEDHAWKQRLWRPFTLESWEKCATGFTERFCFIVWTVVVAFLLSLLVGCQEPARSIPGMSSMTPTFPAPMMVVG